MMKQTQRNRSKISLAAYVASVPAYNQLPAPGPGGHSLALRALAASIAFIPVVGQAQVAIPDAGAILESNRPPALIPPAPTGTRVIPETKPAAAPVIAGQQRLQVQHFVLKGVSAIPEAALQELLQRYLGHALTLQELNQATDDIADYYHRNGYFLAGAYLVPQEVSQGQVTIQVLEGRLAELSLQPDTSLRLKRGIAERYLAARLVSGEAIREADLERPLLLIQDIPGIAARAELRPGKQIGESAVDVHLTEGPLVSGNVGLDNSSNRYTGKERLSAGLAINDASGFGDQISLLGITSGRGFNFGRAGYVVPVGSHGTKLGFAYSAFHYRLADRFAALEASGSGRVGQVFLTHPIIRSRFTNLTFRTGFDNKRYDNAATGTTLSDKHVRTLPVGLALNGQDSYLGGGIFSAAVDVTRGDTDLSRAPTFAADDLAGPRTAGRFTRTNFELGRQQVLGRGWMLVANAVGQFASKNLELGEKISLGGPTRVRAYPAGEASGDEGYILTLEARYALPQFRSDLAIFYDYGHVRLNHDLYPGALAAGNAPNVYSLKGAGIGITWRPTAATVVQLQVATKIGSNPGTNIEGKDTDGSDARTRGWVQVVTSF